MISRKLAHYEVLGRIGAGGMGEVYRARDLTLQRDAAIKILPSELSSGWEERERLKREARTLAALNLGARAISGEFDTLMGCV